MTRCKHGMIPQTCGMCRGMVNADNQTKEYGAGPTLSSRGLTGFMPRANREPLPLRESTEDIVAGPSGRAPTIEEMRETDTPIETEKEEEKAMDKPMCPKGCGRPSPGLRGDGQPKICKECLGETMRRIKQDHEKTPAKGKEPVKPPQNIPENIPVSKTVKTGDSQHAELHKSPDRQSIGLDVLTRLQEELEQKIREARRIHTAMMTIRDVCEVDFKIEALSLVG